MGRLGWGLYPNQKGVPALAAERVQCGGACGGPGHAAVQSAGPAPPHSQLLPSRTGWWPQMSPRRCHCTKHLRLSWARCRGSCCGRLRVGCGPWAACPCPIAPGFVSPASGVPLQSLVPLGQHCGSALLWTSQAGDPRGVFCGSRAVPRLPGVAHRLLREAGPSSGLWRARTVWNGWKGERGWLRGGAETGLQG